jgi:hypothetical protein
MPPGPAWTCSASTPRFPVLCTRYLQQYVFHGTLRSDKRQLSRRFGKRHFLWHIRGRTGSSVGYAPTPHRPGVAGLQRSRSGMTTTHSNCCFQPRRTLHHLVSHLVNSWVAYTCRWLQALGSNPQNLGEKSRFARTGTSQHATDGTQRETGRLEKTLRKHARRRGDKAQVIRGTETFLGLYHHLAKWVAHSLQIGQLWLAGNRGRRGIRADQPFLPSNQSTLPSGPSHQPNSHLHL